MGRKRGGPTGAARFVLNRAALDEVTGGVADGVHDLAVAILGRSHASAPDATPLGEGLVMRGAAMTYVGRQRTAQARTDGAEAVVRKPRRSSRLVKGRVQGIVGWGFPAMFVELGTVHMPARPFLTPAIAAEAPGAGIRLSAAMRRRLAGQRDPRSGEIRDRIAAARARKASAATSSVVSTDGSGALAGLSDVLAAEAARLQGGGG